MKVLSKLFESGNYQTFFPKSALEKNLSLIIILRVRTSNLLTIFKSYKPFLNGELPFHSP